VSILWERGGVVFIDSDDDDEDEEEEVGTVDILFWGW